MTSQPPPREMSSADIDDTAAGMRAAFPGWSFWRSDQGRLWATRSHPLPPSRRPEDYALTLTADTPDLVAAEITRQPDYARST
jgi:hypothetical protein